MIHTAPAHGPEDHAVGLENGLDISCQVDEEGRFDTSTNSSISGMKVLAEGNEKVLEILEERGALILR